MMHAHGFTYLDYAATAPLCTEAAAAMEPFMKPGMESLMFGANANSLHSPGRAAFQMLDKARSTVAACVGATPPELLFTSGATEADNAALLGLANAAVEKRRQKGCALQQPRVVIGALEHPGVKNAALLLKRRGFEVCVAPCDATGLLRRDAYCALLTPNTVLVSVQQANGEVGVVQDIAALSALAHEAGALFHTDATQAFGHIPCDMGVLGVDAASFSGHKIGGPKGIGALYLRARTPFEPLILGGGQEFGRRSGTQNVAGAVGFAAAAQAVCARREAEAVRVSALSRHLYACLCETPGVRRSISPASDANLLPHIVHVLVDGFESETLVLRLDAQGFCVSGGSACSSGSLEPSPVLTALGIQRDAALGALRTSLGPLTSLVDIMRYLQAFRSIVSEGERA